MSLHLGQFLLICAALGVYLIIREWLHRKWR